jgi:predicted nucleic acid-binding Zn ribbon protein
MPAQTVDGRDGSAMTESGRDNSEFIHIREVLEAILPRYQRESNTEMARIRSTWNRLLPPEVSENAQPAGLKNDILLVHVKSSTVAQQLRFLTADIKQALNENGPSRPIETIKFKIGNL